MPNTQLNSAALRPIAWIPALLLAIGLLAYGPTLRASAAAFSVPTLDADGHAQISATPDAAKLIIGARVQSPSAKEAQASLKAIAEKVVAALKNLGVDPKDMQTTDDRVSPLYSTPEHGSPTITGYEASYQLTVLERHLERAGALLDAAIEAGANNVGGIQFVLLDENAVSDEALGAAAQDARRRAEAVAKSLGLHVGRVLNVTVSPSAFPRPVMYAAAKMMDAASSVQPGQITVSADVHVTFELS